MKLIHIIGADISKKTIDLFVHGLNNHLKIQNDVSGFKKFQSWLRRLGLHNPYIVLEHTGYYSYHFENFMHQHQIRFSKVSALAIKRSLGLIRGKTDKIDAKRIAQFGHEKREVLRLETLTEPMLQRLQILSSTRHLLVKQRSSLMCAVKELEVIVDKDDLVIQGQRQLIQALTTQIKNLEKQLKQILTQSAPINHNFKLLVSIKGIGLIVAIATLIKTKNFTVFTNRKKFSCYCGSAPFEHSSGSSIKKGTRVSHLADKTMKTLLTQSARTAIQHDKDLKQYYERRTQMGKSKRSTMNVVRNKLIHRMFAVIKRQTPYVTQYLKSA